MDEVVDPGSVSAPETEGRSCERMYIFSSARSVCYLYGTDAFMGGYALFEGLHLHILLGLIS